MRTAALLTALLLTLTGCSSTYKPAGVPFGAMNAQQQAEVNRARNEQQQAVPPEVNDPVCTSEAECKAMWEAAQAWVAMNMPMKIQTATDTVIFTYNAVNGNTELGAQITKQPLGNGRYSFFSTFGCANMFGCVPNGHDALLSFKRYVWHFSSSNNPVQVKEVK